MRNLSRLKKTITNKNNIINKMTLEERLETFKENGWTYNSETGYIYSHTGNLISGKGNGYIQCSIRRDNKKINVRGHQLGYYLHHNVVPENDIDHIDRNRSNNKIDNLRLATRQENSFNTSVKGYTFRKAKNKWEAQIKVNGKTIHLGSYEHESEASTAYQKAKPMVVKLIENGDAIIKDHEALKKLLRNSI